jgi:ABC-2 type transport system permease protein
MNRVMAIIERELRKFLRSPSLMIATFIFPLVQLVVLGNAFGGKIRDAKVAIVDEDHGTQSIRICEAFISIHSNARTIMPIPYRSERQAIVDVQQGRIQGAVIIPPQYSRRIYEQDHPRVALIVDNSDGFMSSALEQKLREVTDAVNQPDVQPRLLRQLALEVVELYPYVDYMQYLLPGSIALSMFVSVMIGGGILFIEDRARGVHEGYMVTPITKLQLVLGLNLAGAIKAVIAGLSVAIVGSLLAGLRSIFNPSALLGILVMIAVTAISFNTMVFFLMVRVEDPQLPRVIIGTLNTLLFFPSGAVYPVQAFPGWLQTFAKGDPFSYVVHGLKSVILKGTGLAAIWTDAFALLIVAIVTFGLSVPLFKRSL